MPIIIKCKRCNKPFGVSPSRIGVRSFCGRKCANLNKIGRPSPNKGRKMPNAYLNLGKFAKKGNPAWNKNKPRTWNAGNPFMKGHTPWNKGKKIKDIVGYGNWRGGKRISKGYVEVYSPNHPFKSANDTVKEHRLVMERFLGRYLEPTEVVHHKNGNALDNRINNLTLFSKNSDHMAFHHPKGIKFHKLNPPIAL